LWDKENKVVPFNNAAVPVVAVTYATESGYIYWWNSITEERS
jgi:hypothetical protein